MPIVSSHMISKHYCSRCNSFDLVKLHRNFLHKRILRTENKLQCKACARVFKRVDFEQNIPREVPVFLETESPPVVSAPQSNKAEAPSQRKSVISNAVPPPQSDNDKLEDTPRQSKEKKGFWPYVVASLLLLFTTAYAFIFMPMSLSAKEDEIIQRDMSIGQVEQYQVETSAEPDFSPKQVSLSTVPELEELPVKKPIGQLIIPNELASEPQAPKCEHCPSRKSCGWFSCS